MLKSSAGLPISFFVMIPWDDTPQAHRLHDRVARLEGWVLLALAVYGATTAAAGARSGFVTAAMIATGAVGVLVAARTSRSEPATLARGIVVTALGLALMVRMGPDAPPYALWLVAVAFTYPFLVGGWGGLLVPAAAAVGSLLLLADPSATTGMLPGVARAGLVIAMGLVGRRLRQLYLDDLRRLQATADHARDRSHYAAAVLESMPAPTAVLGADGIIHATNRAWQELSAGLAIGRTVATPFGWFCEHALTADPLAAAHVRGESLAVAGGLAPGPFEIEVRFDPVDSRWFRLVATSLPASVGGALVTLTDITPELEHDALVHRVHHDALTGLPNRVRFSQVLGEIVAAPEASLAAVLFIDLDRFKHVNDTYGHAAGDELLVAVAQRLQAALRPGDTLARLAGDEFAACCPNLSDRSAAVHLAQRIVLALDVPFDVAGRHLRATASVGVAVAEPGMAPEEILARADRAMYEVKRAGRRGLALADPIDLRSGGRTHAFVRD
jgi:diguanylate cyclase (GGDEF)-like protein